MSLTSRDGLTVLELCADCIALLENRHVERDGEDVTVQHAAEMEAQWSLEDGYIEVGDLGDPSFVKDSCDGCGNPDHGSRWEGYWIDVPVSAP